MHKGDANHRNNNTVNGIKQLRLHIAKLREVGDFVSVRSGWKDGGDGGS